MRREKKFSILPYIKGTTDRIDRILNKYNIQIIFKSLKKIRQILRKPKDQRPLLSSAGIYTTHCFCGKVYIGETGRMVNIGMKEHQRDVRLKYITQSALSEHNIETGHQNDYNSHYYIRFPKKVQGGYRDTETT